MLDWQVNDKTVVAADMNNDSWEIDDDPRVMVEGQSGDVCCVNPYPLEGKGALSRTAT